MVGKDDLRKAAERDAERLSDAERNRGSLISQTVFLGTLALLFVVPVILGAYLGQWIDEMSSGYSATWTVSFIFLGIGFGVMNVYLFIRERS
ncbi:MAG TPA: AtpZ/AtpI family protein [Alphaproteobacteria bacterium]|nr:AtpZ/AtpI family protein [Alphaproteobacteria bacterium]HNS45211.1 AtpZ/AtpI family protein [Alphaproteobacteria bacterium]